MSAEYRVHISVGVDVIADSENDALSAAVDKVRSIIADQPAWVSGLCGGITGLHTDNTLVYRQKEVKP